MGTTSPCLLPLPFSSRSPPDHSRPLLSVVPGGLINRLEFFAPEPRWGAGELTAAFSGIESPKTNFCLLPIPPQKKKNPGYAYAIDIW